MADTLTKEQIEEWRRTGEYPSGLGQREFRDLLALRALSASPSATVAQEPFGWVYYNKWLSSPPVFCIGPKRPEDHDYWQPVYTKDQIVAPRVEAEALSYICQCGDRVVRLSDIT